ncbi:hypothetical protein [Limosilactobacillus reuteri]|nr:hypothetical protein [Limosilactobacillus reuteri]
MHKDYRRQNLGYALLRYAQNKLKII